MVTLSQILVVHNRGRYVKAIRKLALSRHGVNGGAEAGRRMKSPVADHNSLFGMSLGSQKLLNDIYVSRIASLIRLASNFSKTRLNLREAAVTARGFHANVASLSSLSSSSSSLHSSMLSSSNNDYNTKNNRLLADGGSPLSHAPKGERVPLNQHQQQLSLHLPQNLSLHDTQFQNRTSLVNLAGRNFSDDDLYDNNRHNGEDLDLGFDQINLKSRNIPMLNLYKSMWDVTRLRRMKVYCPEISPDLQGKMKVDFNQLKFLAPKDIIQQNQDLMVGGAWRPHHCISRHRVAIIIPYRDRRHHLLTLLYYLLPMLKRQQLDFRVYVVEQYGNATFNKGRIMNAAYKEALKQNSFHCFVFHDVDLIPEDDRNMYSCPPFPRHLSVAIDEMEYRLAYELLVGGVLNMKTEHFQLVNGYSNMYWGWGGEDDDMAYRILYKRLKIIRPPTAVARYKMVRHQKRKPASWKKRSRLLQTGRKRLKYDGLNSVQYKVVFTHNDPLFTHFMVDIGPAPPR